AWWSAPGPPPADDPAALADPREPGGVEHARRRLVLDLGSCGDLADAGVSKGPVDQGSRGLGRVAAASTIGDHAEADFDEAAVGRAHEAYVAAEGVLVALDNQPDPEALGVGLGGGLHGQDVEEVRLRPGIGQARSD